MAKQADYEAKEIHVLEGLEPVRKRPGMYIGSTDERGLWIMIKEIIDNSVDEALAGNGKDIWITLHKDNFVTVADMGRGIPYEIHPQTGKSALEVSMTVLHAGGKFGDGAYKVSGGLHGVGSSAVNALSQFMRVETRRGGKIYYQEYTQGKPRFSVKELQKGDEPKDYSYYFDWPGKSGVRTTFKADPEIMQMIEPKWETVLREVKNRAYLVAGIAFHLYDERTGKEINYYFDSGIIALVRHINKSKGVVNSNPVFIHKTVNEVDVEIAMQYSDSLNQNVESYANVQATKDGGTHLTGFKTALTRAINDYARKNGYLKEKDENLTGDDTLEGLTAVVTVKMDSDILQFESQTKDKLGNAEVGPIVSQVTKEGLDTYFEENPSEGRRIIEKVLLAARADILLQQGYLKPEQLSAVKLESINSGIPPEKIILDRNYVSADKIAQARAVMIGVPFLSLEGRAISPEVLNLIPEPVARRYKLIPVEKEGDSLVVAMADPLDLQVIEFIEKKAGMKIKRFLSLPEDIQRAITEQYSQNLTTDVTSALQEVAQSAPEALPAEDKAEVIRDAPVANIVTQLLEYAVKANASDIHIEPSETQTRVRYRIDGILHEKVILPKKVHDALLSRIKILANLKIDERRLPQDGRFTFDYGGKEVDLRISTLPTVFGEKVVLRLLPKSQKAPTLIELGLRGSPLKNLELQLQRSHGIILICGPTGSGKTTTLYSILTKLSTSKVNILTIEDPVEYQIQGVNQVQVNPTIGLTFASALRSFLRQDPNVILVGEIRDTETAELAIQAALTGHQVFSTLHTNSASGALPRLLDMGSEPFLLASAINAVVSQRILRKICPHCKAPYTPPPEVVDNLKQVLGKIAPAALSNPTGVRLFKGVGCEQCGHTGYLGRTGIYEVLVVTAKIMQLILERASSQEIEQQAVAEGMITLKQDGYLKVLEGITTLEEVLRVAQD